VVSGASANSRYDLYFVNTFMYQHWMWRLLYADLQCDAAGTATIVLTQPDPYQGYFILLDALDDDNDGLSTVMKTGSRFESRGTITGNPDSDGEWNGRRLGNQYACDPTLYEDKGGPDWDYDGDFLTNQEEHDFYDVNNARYDPLKQENRPTLSISAQCPTLFAPSASFTISRNAGLRVTPSRTEAC